MIRNTLTYKATLIGKRVETVSPTWTSQIDCMTGKRDGQRKGCRYYSTLGVVYDADWNAAINIRNRKLSKISNLDKHSLSSSLPLDGGLTFGDRLQSTSRMRCNNNLKPLGL